MKIIAVVSQKGGVGKTTVSQVLSVEALNQGFASALIDTDPQKSATEWGDQRTAAGIEAPTVVTPAGQGLRSILNELEERGAAIVFIDTPPHSAPAINAALEVATGAILVTRPNPMDLSALVPLHSSFDRLAPEAVRSGKGCFQAERCSGRGLGKDNSRRSGLGSDQ